MPVPIQWIYDLLIPEKLTNLRTLRIGLFVKLCRNLGLNIWFLEQDERPIVGITRKSYGCFSFVGLSTALEGDLTSTWTKEKNCFFSIFLGGALDPLGEFVRPPGPTLEKTIFYNFLKIWFFGYKWLFFQSCDILVWTMRFSIFHSIYEHIFTTGFRNFQIRCHSGTLRSHL